MGFEQLGARALDLSRESSGFYNLVQHSVEAQPCLLSHTLV